MGQISIKKDTTQNAINFDLAISFTYTLLSIYKIMNPFEK
ncbi:hypothetical protein C7972_109182 [Arenibacter sp. ARW7G5Y1]|nr:hypothetical protein C7972_109182 [Arenibacter sp. ARW7G5Y1]